VFKGRDGQDVFLLNPYGRLFSPLGLTATSTMAFVIELGSGMTIDF